MKLDELQKAWDKNRKEFETIENEIKRHKLAMEKLDKRKIENYKEFEELYYFGTIENSYVLSEDNEIWKNPKLVNDLIENGD